MDGLARNASSLSDLLDLLVSGDANLLEGSWKTNLKAEVLDLVELLLRNALKNKLDQGTKSNAVAVRCAVATKGGEAVVEGVSCCAVNVVSADTTHVDGCLADSLKSWGYNVVLASLNCLCTVIAKGEVALLSNCHTNAGNAGSLKGRRLGADGCAALKVGAQCVAHACYQEGNRCVSDDLGVDHNCIWILWVEEVLVKGTVIVVNNGEAGAWSVGSCNGRKNNDALTSVICGCLCGVNSAAAADSDDYVDVVLLDDSLHAVNLAVGRDATEDLVATVIVALALEALLDHVVGCFVAAVRANKQEALSHVAHLFFKLETSIFALNILQWLTHCA